MIPSSHVPGHPARCRLCSDQREGRLKGLVFMFDELGLFASTKTTLDEYKYEEDENQNDDEDDDRDANHHPEVEVVFRLDIAHT